MTNAQIIMNESINLLENGIIKGTGRMLEALIVDKDGNETKKLVEEPEAIHTYAVWKQLGFQVKKGEKAGLYTALDFGCVWLERALAGK